MVGSIAPESASPTPPPTEAGSRCGSVTRRREHYEAQLIRLDGEVVLEIGFHAEHAKPAENDAAIDRLAAAEGAWRRALGAEPVAGPFLGRQGWTRVSETWTAPGFDDIDEVIEVAARLADYVNTLEPVRRST